MYHLCSRRNRRPGACQAHRAAAWGSPAKRRVTALINLRNLVAAPLSEEFVFRGCMLPLLLLEARRRTPLEPPLAKPHTDLGPA